MKRQRSTQAERSAHSKEVGLNRFVWNLAYPTRRRRKRRRRHEVVEGGIPGCGSAWLIQGSPAGRRAAVRARFRGFAKIRGWRPPTLAAGQFDLLKQVHEKLSETHKAINELRALRRRAQDWAARAKDKPELDAVASAAQSVIDRLKPIEAS